MNTSLVTHRLNVACLKALQKETDHLIRERELKPEDGLEMELLRASQFDEEAVKDAYNCDSLEEVKQYIKEDYYMNYNIN